MLEEILNKTRASGFTMSSDEETGRLLSTLAGTKPGGRFLELGTGTGLSTAWILSGMDNRSKLITLENSAEYLQIARDTLENDPRCQFVQTDAGEWIGNHMNDQFDYIFADTWHGKYLMLDETLALLAPGGIYVVDDMLPQPNWPEGHEEKAQALSDHLLSRKDLQCVRLAHATGIIIGVKKAN